MKYFLFACSGLLSIIFIPLTTFCMKESKTRIDSYTIGDYQNITHLISYLQSLKTVFECFKNEKKSATKAPTHFISALTSFIKSQIHSNSSKDPFMERFGYPFLNATDHDSGIINKKEVDLLHPRALSLLPAAAHNILKTRHRAHLNESKKEWSDRTPEERKAITLLLFSESYPTLKSICAEHHETIQKTISDLQARLTELCSLYADPTLLWEPYIL